MHLIFSVTIRHLPYLAGGLAIGVVVALAAEPRSTVQMLSLATAYASFLYVSAALIIAPIKLLSGGAVGLSNGLRRNLGIWSAIFAFAHVVAGLGVHFNGRFWLYFLYPAESEKYIPLRYDAFGFTNYLGIIATVIFAVLLMISNDNSIRNLGPQRWKRVQRLSYPLFVMLFLHGAIYQVLEQRGFAFILIIVSVFCVVAFYQARGFLKRRRKA